MWQRMSEKLSRARPSRWPTQLSGVSPGLRRGVSLLVTIALVLSMVTVAIWPASSSASYSEVLYNGGFENGFSNQGGCGMVGSGWQCFTNGGGANYGFYDDQWPPVVAEGKNSQLIEINTKGIVDASPDRYAGIYQTVPVVDWAEYTLDLAGMIRTTSMDGDKWRYQVQVGWTFGPTADWSKVTNWTDTGWYTYYEREKPGAFSRFSTSFMAESDYVTVYVRVWKKWGISNEELNVNLDDISLVGPSPYSYHPQPIPFDGYDDEYKDGYAGHPEGHPATYPGEPLPAGHPPVYPDGAYRPVHPPVADGSVCWGPNLVYNGDFERGFNAVSVGQVGNSWGFFTTAGGANYGFYDDEWPPVVADGKHSQLIEINTKGGPPLENDRYAGIYQYITGLQPGVTYEFSMKGLLRGTGNEDDPFRFAAQWGYNPGYNGDWKAVKDWTEMNLGPISKRTEPGPMATWTMKFVAQSHDITLFIRGWKKWAINNVEMDFNIDAVGVRACGPTGGPVHPIEPPIDCGDPCGPVHPIEPPIYHPPADCGEPCGPVHPIEPPIYHPPADCGEPCGPVHPIEPPIYHPPADCGEPCGPVHPIEPPIYHPDGGCGEPCGGPWYPGDSCVYVVKPGDTLAGVAAWLGVSIYDLIAVNGIVNPNLIYVGQQLTIPGCATTLPAVDPGYPVGPSQGTYTVQPGDSLSAIAAWYGTTVWVLCDLNGIYDPNFIYVGQVLILP